MADWLIVRMQGDPDAGVTWMAADPDGRLLLAPRHGTLEQALAERGPRRLAVLVPSADVLLTDAVLPAKSGAKLAQVVPFALEEQLADDIESLHFATGRRDPATGKTPVAVVERALIEAWLARLAALGAAPDALYAEADLVPGNPGQLMAWLDGETLVVRAPQRCPSTVSVTTLRDAFEFLAASGAYGEGVTAASISLQLSTPPADWQQHAGELSFLQEHFAGARVQLLPQGSLPWLASHLPNVAPINLLQGAHTPKRAASADLARWRLPAALAAALLALFIGGNILTITRLNAVERTLDSEIEQTFRMAMPGAQGATDARRRMEQRLLALQSGGAQGGLLPALGAFAVARANVPTATLESLSLRDGALDLRVRAPDADSLDRISQQMQANGLAAQLTGSQSTEGGYEGRIQVRLGGAT
jgi:general secretion pathway protein L